MKKYILLLLPLFLFAGIAKASDDSDSLGLPGDNLDLQGVLDLFRQSSSVEDFEKKLNDPANEVNNLDLNGDNNVDYIRVVDQMDGDAHAIILQVPVSETESQDVAAIEVEKDGTESAKLQIVGDEELYGKDYIVEPGDDANSSVDQKWQGFRPVVVVNVWLWPCVRYIYAPGYVVWVSPWRWAVYPMWWHPWHPVFWHIHHARVMRYHTHCVIVHECRVTHANVVYSHHRTASPSVHRNYAAAHERHAQRSAAPAQRGGAERAGGAEKTGGQKGGNANRDMSSPKASGKTAPGQKGGGGGHKQAPGGAAKRGPGGGGGQKAGGGGKRAGGGGARPGPRGGGGGKHR